MPRHLDNWLYAFRDWTVPRSEAQESLIIWSGLFALSSVVKRNVYIPKAVMGSYDIYPNLYIIFVGPPGAIRKSTTAGYAQRLLTDLETVTIASTAMSVSKMVEVMKETPDGSLCIISSEFASFVNVSQEEMYDALTDLYDNVSRFEYSTRTHGVEIVEEPSVNMLGATTPGWVSDRMPISAIGGGFASRIIFVFENQVRQRRLYYDLDWQWYKDQASALRKDLHHISEIRGTFTHDSDDTKKAMESWYQETADQPASDERIEGYLQRKHVHVHKVAMLLSLAESDELVIDMTHFNAAKALLESIEEKMPRVFSSVGKNPYSADLEGILDFVAGYGEEWVPKSKIASRFYHNLDISGLNEILSALVVMGEIEHERRTAGKKKEDCFRLLTDSAI